MPNTGMVNRKTFLNVTFTGISCDHIYMKITYSGEHHQITIKEIDNDLSNNKYHMKIFLLKISRNFVQAEMSARGNFRLIFTLC